MRRALFFLIIIFSFASLAKFDNSKLFELGKIDFSSERKYESCVNYDSEHPFGFIMGDTPDPKKKVKLYYQHIINDPSLPTLIQLPGGPGGSSIGYYEDFEHLSSLFNLLFIDPRGFGCNFMGSDTDLLIYDNLGNHRVADDVLKIVKKEKLTDFYIFGVSYGTLLSTVVAHKLESNGLAPKALILEGVIGKAFKRWSEEKSIIEANNYNTYLKSNPWLITLIKRVQNLGKDPKFFFKHFMKSLFRDNGTLAPEDWILEELENLKSASDEALIKAIEEKESRLKNSTTFVDRTSVDFVMTNRVACTEMSEEDIDFDKTWDLTLNKVVPVQESNIDLCETESFSNPYDSKDYQVSAPIYYIQGDEDPATPLSGAIYHLNNQSVNNNKHLVEVKGAGHSPFYETLQSCQINIWRDIKENSGKPLSALDDSGHCK